MSKNITAKQTDLLATIVDDAAQKLTAQFEDMMEETSESDDYSLSKQSAIKRCKKIIKIAEQLRRRLLSFEAKVHHPEL